MAIITNPVFASVVIMLVLCVLHVNVYLAIIIAAVIMAIGAITYNPRSINNKK